MSDIVLYLDTAAVTVDLIRSDEVAERWDDASALRGMSVAGLAGHLARSILRTEPFLDQERCEGRPLSAVEFYLAGDDPTDFDSKASVRIRETGTETAACGAAALGTSVDVALARLGHRLPDEELDEVRMWFGRVATTRTVLQARILEMVVHVDDLAVSVGVPTPDLPAGAMDLTLRMLVDMARRRHGELAVVRSLARRERDAVDALRVL